MSARCRCNPTESNGGSSSWCERCEQPKGFAAFDTGDLGSPPGKFASHFAVTATHGLTPIRYVGPSVAACEKWAAERLAEGYTVSHVWRFDGDNVFEIDQREENEAV